MPRYQTRDVDERRRSRVEPGFEREFNVRERSRTIRRKEVAFTVDSRARVARINDEPLTKSRITVGTRWNKNFSALDARVRSRDAHRSSIDPVLDAAPRYNNELARDDQQRWRRANLPAHTRRAFYLILLISPHPPSFLPAEWPRIGDRKRTFSLSSPRSPRERYFATRLRTRGITASSVAIHRFLPRTKGRRSYLASVVFLPVASKRNARFPFRSRAASLVVLALRPMRALSR